MPKEFSEDGAIGAGSSGGAPTGGVTQSDFGGNGNSSFGGAQPSSGQGGGYTPPSSAYTGANNTYAQLREQGQDDMLNAVGQGAWASSATSNPANPVSFIGQGPQHTGGFNRVAGFSAGGAIPDSDIDGSPGQDAISKSLSTIDQVLAFGRKLHGLGGGDDEGGAIQTAQRMPSIPGSQSESGRPPVQPMPGPLPPTSNPFGKRADASQDSDGDNDNDANGAIDTDEDAA